MPPVESPEVFAFTQIKAKAIEFEVAFRLRPNSRSAPQISENALLARNICFPRRGRSPTAIFSRNLGYQPLNLPD